MKEGVKINFDEGQAASKDPVLVDQAVIYRQMQKVFAVKQVIRFEVERNDVFELSAASSPL